MLGACNCGDCTVHVEQRPSSGHLTSSERASPCDCESTSEPSRSRERYSPSFTTFEEWEDWDESLPFWKHAVAGSCAGVMEHLGMYPLDTVKTHMQARRPNGQAPPRVSDVVRGIVRSPDGALGFMRGCSAIAGGCIPAHVALFTSYEYTKRRLLSGSEHEPMKAAVCGASATLCHDVILTPMDVVKQRMQLGLYRSIGHCITSVCHSEGFTSLYRSLPTTLAMNVPYGGVLVAANESLKRSFGLTRMEDEVDQLSALRWYFLSAAISGAVAAGVTQPLDVVKTRLQTQDCLEIKKADALHEPMVTARVPDRRAPALRYSGAVGTLSCILREEGMSALFHGMVPRMFHAMPSAALCWGTYEMVKLSLS
eukprot:gnl/TRDRNA2_/TRDRNA2_202488_c0_seq1.p1 gnl/TRDRNA2_/TRDRNA2_202488_c0~~gnl/TRDRNA2_/TRDRNA2_202488_c0_seq1.p1  ORF type:complete len:368 (-),score=26.96 gnl/TRDRNA2_/TRDRNA2_202488_c0_seq1:134-1237(-)